MEIKDKCFCVTGGANGLGKSISQAILSEGGHVIILDHDSDSLNLFKNESKILPILCDLTDERQITQALVEATSIFPKIHGLINNAGILYSEPLIKLTEKNARHSVEKWQRVIDINLKTPFIMASHFAEHMISKRIKGVIVNISSISAQGNIGQSAYSAAKAGLEAMTKVWAKELGVFGIRSFAIAPGFFDTASTVNIVKPNLLNDIKNKVPLKRLGRENEIAHAVISSINNDYINGTILEVNGGLNL